MQKRQARWDGPAPPLGAWSSCPRESMSVTMYCNLRGMKCSLKIEELLVTCGPSCAPCVEYHQLQTIDLKSLPSAVGLLFANSSRLVFHPVTSASSTTSRITRDPLRLISEICSGVRVSRSLNSTWGMYCNAEGKCQYLVRQYMKLRNGFTFGPVAAISLVRFSRASSSSVHALVARSWKLGYESAI